MCMIVDINVAAKVLVINDDPDFKHVHDSLFAENNNLNAKIMYGGKLTEEYNRHHGVRRILLQLDRAGKAVRVDDAAIENEVEAVVSTQLCESNDEHIIALARVSEARLLCSHDISLHADFTNGRLIGNPRGKVYQNATHKALLRRFCR